MKHNVGYQVEISKSVEGQQFWNEVIMYKPIDEYMEWARKLNQDILGKTWKVSRTRERE